MRRPGAPALGGPLANDPGTASRGAGTAAPGLELRGGIECTIAPSGAPDGAGRFSMVSGRTILRGRARPSRHPLRGADGRSPVRRWPKLMRGRVPQR